MQKTNFKKNNTLVTNYEAACRKVIPSKELFEGQQQVLIDHLGQIYHLRQTIAGKLILTK